MFFLACQISASVFCAFAMIYEKNHKHKTTYCSSSVHRGRLFSLRFSYGARSTQLFALYFVATCCFPSHSCRVCLYSLVRMNLCMVLSAMFPLLFCANIWRVRLRRAPKSPPQKSNDACIRVTLHVYVVRCYSLRACILYEF